jgi:hypothetical protein
MNEVFILSLESAKSLPKQVFSLSEFYGYFGIEHKLITSWEDWRQLLISMDYDPDCYYLSYGVNGCDLETIKQLDENGYIEDTECYSLDCYYYKGQFYITPYQDQIKSGKHISQAWLMLVDKIESNTNFKVYYK